MTANGFSLWAERHKLGIIGKDIVSGVDIVNENPFVVVDENPVEILEVIATCIKKGTANAGGFNLWAFTNGKRNDLFTEDLVIKSTCDVGQTITLYRRNFCNNTKAPNDLKVVQYVEDNNFKLESGEMVAIDEGYVGSVDQGWFEIEIVFDTKRGREKTFNRGATPARIGGTVDNTYPLSLLNNGFKYNIKSLTAGNYTIVETKNTIFVCNCAAGDINITPPAAAAANKGIVFIIRRIDTITTTTVKYTANFQGSISGYTNPCLNGGGDLAIFSDGSAWRLFYKTEEPILLAAAADLTLAGINWQAKEMTFLMNDAVCSITLPTAAYGVKFIIKCIVGATNNNKIIGTIDGVANKIMSNKYDCYTVQDVRGDWYYVGKSLA